MRIPQLVGAPVIVMLAAGCGMLGGSPDIALDDDVVYVGELRADEVGETIVPVHNRGGGPLVIDKVVSHCKCTMAQMVSEDDKTIPPGESRDLRVIINAADAPSLTPKSRVTIISNDRARPGLSFRATATISPGMEVLSEAFDFGEAPVGASAEARIRVRSGQHADIQLLAGGDPLNKPDFVKEVRVDDVPPEEWESDDSPEYDLVAVLAPQDKPGTRKGNILIPHRALHVGLLQLEARATIVVPDAPVDGDRSGDSA